MGVSETSKLSASEAYAQGLIGGSLTAQAHCRRVEPLPSHPPFQHYSVSLSIPSLSPLTLIMAVGPGEWMTEVNAPRRKGAIVNEAEVKMSGWNRQIKEMKDEVDVWREHVKRDWHSREKERELQVITSQLWSFFFSYLSCSGIFPLTTHYSDHHWHLLYILSCYPLPFSNVWKWQRFQTHRKLGEILWVLVHQLIQICKCTHGH